MPERPPELTPPWFEPPKTPEPEEPEPQPETQVAAASAAVLPQAPYQPPEIKDLKSSEAGPLQAPQAGLPPVVPPPAPAVHEGHHAFIGNTAQPAGIGIPFTSPSGSAQPDWAAPYDLIPMDPLNNASSSTSSEFGSTPVSVAPETAQNNFGQGHAISAPPELAGQAGPSVAPAVDTARSAVEQAISAAPFDPAFGAPVQALNAQPLSPQPIHNEAPPTELNLPPMKTSDTPMLVLPTDGGNSVTATQPIATQAPNNFVSGVAPPAPPPVPPPLMAAPGAVIPNLPPQSR